ncbi:MAG: GNAT family N-acetyltransferase [Gaiellaceae bacterium]
MDVHPIPGLEHLPYAEVWFHAVDEDAWHAASAAARAIDKTGLEVWTTTRTPGVASWLEGKGYDEVRRYVISELDVAAAPDLGDPTFEIVTFADRPDLEEELHALARLAYADQPGRSDSRIDNWPEWGLHAHRAEGYFIALENGRLLGYGYLALEGGTWSNGFMAVARDERGRGVAGALKRAQIRWAKAEGISRLRTANEVRLDSMLALNRRFGYELLYEEIVLRGPLAEDLRR